MGEFYPKKADSSSYYTKKNIDSIISLKAETHNFPTTVEPYNGAATGSGGEIRDRLAGGIGSIPLIGTAVYMTPYSRLNKENLWEDGFKGRKWKYQTPSQLLIKASNGASDFGNCFGQPLISGSLFTFEHSEEDQHLGYDKVIMLAGGVGFGEAKQSQKKIPQEGDLIVMLGGDNYAFCKTNEKGEILEIREKQPFTDNKMGEFASTGTYYFKKGSYVKKYFKELIEKD